MKTQTSVFLAIAIAAGGLGLAATADNGGFESLAIMKAGYPRAYFFRYAEGAARNRKNTFEQWDQSFSRLMGIEGKALDEELVNLQERNTEFFTRFKKLHPDQMVLLHFNGNARNPDFESSEFFAGHWAYFNGSKVLSDMAAGETESEIRVADPTLYRTGVGRSRDRNEDIGICELDSAGKPNWLASEQVQLISVNRQAGTIRVKRGLHGTKARAFAAGKTYAAAHMYEGPAQDGLMWFYNYSTTCPRDAKGRTAADVLVEEMRRRFAPGGPFATFDGLQFDVLFFDANERNSGGRSMDANADGKPDGGIIEGVNAYGIGVTNYLRKLRDAFPAGKILNADGMELRNQRSFGVINGMESEGFPELRDHTMADWSGGLNRLDFWRLNARNPVFNYINHKYIAPNGGPTTDKHPDIPWGIHRLSFAAAVFTDSAICYSYSVESAPGELVGIWDELWKGTEHQVGYLGMPTGPAIHLAQKQPDILGPAALGRLSGAGVRIERVSSGVRIVNSDAKSSETRVVLNDMRTSGPDLVVVLTARGVPMGKYPKEIGRAIHLGVAGSDQKFMSWMNEKDFTSTFYFRGISKPTVDLELSVEGNEPFFITSLSGYAYPDAMYRAFERGVVIANPSEHAFTFDMGRIAGSQQLRRLRGSATQDSKSNNGERVGQVLALPAKDALFLVKE
jgi:hypothetical protein